MRLSAWGEDEEWDGTAENKDGRAAKRCISTDVYSLSDRLEHHTASVTDEHTESGMGVCSTPENENFFLALTCQILLKASCKLKKNIYLQKAEWRL